jgi:RimJ/RimL family protein N-acetyltransferase
VRRLTAHIHPDHVASAKVARRLGMVATGDVDSGGEQIWFGELSPPRTPG